MKFNCTIVSGKLLLSKSFDSFVKKQKDGKFTIEIKKFKNLRSDLQNDSLHLWFDQMSERFNELGIDMRVILKSTFFLFWTPHAVKEYLWRPIQKNMFGIESTTKINTQEMNKIYKVIHLAMVDKTKGEVDIPFPNKRELMNREEYGQ